MIHALRLLVALLLTAASSAAPAAELTFQDVVTGGLNGVPALGGVRETALSHDGRHLYAACTDAGLVAVFARNASTGALTFVEALAGITGAHTVLVGPEGRSLYVTGSAGISRFGRDTATGQLSARPVEPIGASAGLAITSDGRHLYAAAADRIVAYFRNPASGALTAVDTDFDGPARRFGSATHLQVSPDGRHLYAASSTESALTLFVRDPLGDVLTWAGEVGGAIVPTDFEFSPDGTRVYAGASGAAVGSARYVTYARNLLTGALALDESIDVAAFTAAALAIEPDGSHFFGGGSDEIAIFDADSAGATSVTRETPNVVDGAGTATGMENVRGLTTSPDGRHVYAASSDGADTIAIFATATFDFLAATRDIGDTPALTGVTSAVVSHDGRFAYATGSGEAAIQVFSRDITTGALTGIQTVRDGVAGASGLAGVRALVLSPDGTAAYAVSAEANAVVSFARNPAGLLTYLGKTVDGAGAAQRLAGPFAITIDPDGQHVYVASDLESAVTTFDVVPGAALVPTGFVADGVGGVDGLLLARAVAVSPDGRFVHAGGAGENAIAVFARDTASGSLGFVAKVMNGALAGVSSVAISPDGRFLYATAFNADALVRYTRNVATGALTLPLVRSHTTNVDDGLADPVAVILSADGRRLFVAGEDGDVAAVYRRNRSNGAVTLLQAETDGVRVDGALAGVQGIATSSDGRNFYVAAANANAVVAFAPEPGTGAFGAALGALHVLRSRRSARRRRRKSP